MCRLPCALYHPPLIPLSINDRLDPTLFVSVVGETGSCLHARNRLVLALAQTGVRTVGLTTPTIPVLIKARIYTYRDYKVTNQNSAELE